MVYLSRIYTKTGDAGTTQLGDGSTLPKHHPRVASYGTVDELSSVIGLALLHMTGEGEIGREAGWLRTVQNDLFDVGADLCVPGEAGAALRLKPLYTERLEALIDEYNARLEPLASFILPGGSQAAAWLHLGRTVCRRAERLVTELAEGEDEQVNPEVLRYLNRHSDLLFVLGRIANDDGRDDVLWKPGASQAPSADE